MLVFNLHFIWSLSGEFPWICALLSLILIFCIYKLSRISYINNRIYERNYNWYFIVKHFHLSIYEKDSGQILIRFNPTPTLLSQWKRHLWTMWEKSFPLKLVSTSYNVILVKNFCTSFQRLESHFWFCYRCFLCFLHLKISPGNVCSGSVGQL